MKSDRHIQQPTSLRSTFAREQEAGGTLKQNGATERYNFIAWRNVLMKWADLLH